MVWLTYRAKIFIQRALELLKITDPANQEMLDKEITARFGSNQYRVR